jgi:hypothetical protein
MKTIVKIQRLSKYKKQGYLVPEKEMCGAELKILQVVLFDEGLSAREHIPHSILRIYIQYL